MYTLKVPTASQHTALSRAFSEELLNKKIDMVDRRAVTALILGTIAGGSLPVQEGSYHQIASVYRTQHLPLVREWLGRLSEVVIIDQELALIAAFNRYRLRCTIAFPKVATLGLSAPVGSDDAMTEQTKLFSDLLQRYPELCADVGWGVASLITRENTHV